MNLQKKLHRLTLLTLFLTASAYSEEIMFTAENVQKYADHKDKFLDFALANINTTHPAMLDAIKALITHYADTRELLSRSMLKNREVVNHSLLECMALHDAGFAAQAGLKVAKDRSGNSVVTKEGSALNNVAWKYLINPTISYFPQNIVCDGAWRSVEDAIKAQVKDATARKAALAWVRGEEGAQWSDVSAEAQAVMIEHGLQVSNIAKGISNTYQQSLEKSLYTLPRSLVSGAITRCTRETILDKLDEATDGKYRIQGPLYNPQGSNLKYYGYGLAKLVAVNLVLDGAIGSCITDPALNRISSFIWPK